MSSDLRPSSLGPLLACRSSSQTPPRGRARDAQGKCLSEMTVESAMSRAVYGCSPDDDVEKAAGLMRLRQVRRVPVLDGDRRLLGVISLSDFARALAVNASNGVTTPTVARTLFDISQPAVCIGSTRVHGVRLRPSPTGSLGFCAHSFASSRWPRLAPTSQTKPAFEDLPQAKKTV